MRFVYVERAGGIAGVVAVVVGFAHVEGVLAVAVAEPDSVQSDLAEAAGSGRTEGVVVGAVGVAPAERVDIVVVGIGDGSAVQDLARHTAHWAADTTAVAVVAGAEDIAADVVADAVGDAAVLAAGQFLVERATETVEEERSEQHEGADTASPI